MPEVVAIFLVGSYARGYAKDSSDVDLAVILHPYSERASAWASAHSSPYGVDVVVLNEKKPHQRYMLMVGERLLSVRDREALKSVIWHYTDEFQAHLLLWRGTLLRV